jgi:hypothetical protein
MKNTLIKRIISIDELPKPRRRKAGHVERLLLNSIAVLVEGQAAEIRKVCSPVHLRWKLKVLMNQGRAPENMRLSLRKGCDGQRTAYLVKFPVDSEIMSSSAGAEPISVSTIFGIPAPLTL